MKQIKYTALLSMVVLLSTVGALARDKNQHSVEISDSRTSRWHATETWQLQGRVARNRPGDRSEFRARWKNCCHGARNIEDE